MRPVVIPFLLAALAACAYADDLSGRVKKAVEQSTLDQPGTKPFHLKATYAPSLERDKESHRNGEIEIWWESPTRWRRELSSPEFHQVLIVNGARQWQKNQGDYFPDWLRQLAEAIVRPFPFAMDVLLGRVKNAEVRRLAGQTNIDWDPDTGWGDTQSDGKGYLSLFDQTGMLFYTGGPGYGGLYKDFHNFHSRKVAYKISSGWTEVTAQITLFEDLGNTPKELFNVDAPDGDPPIDTVVLDEKELRKNLLSGDSFDWPPVKDGPLEGIARTTIVLDRTGKIREMNPPVSDNPGMVEAADRGMRSMQFQPVLRNGVPVQAVGPLVVPFKTVRPAGVETLDSARNYFERGRKASCLGAGATAPYCCELSSKRAILAASSRRDATKTHGSARRNGSAKLGLAQATWCVLRLATSTMS